MNAGIPADWVASAIDPLAFRREQEKLSRVWTFLGLAREVANDGDWFRASLATRSVFVQRFGENLRGFENICPHRFFPLRTADRGNGPILCGHHHWLYDKEGRAVGMPLGKELFGSLPQQMGVRLTQVEIAVCGELIFGRFATEGGEGLEAFLGELHPVIAAMSRTRIEPIAIERPVAANWKLCFHTTLDDYHAPAVHPETLGKNGYNRRKDFCYVRAGLHSAMVYSPDPQSFDKVIAHCRSGTYKSSAYFIIQLLPDLTLVHSHAYADHWYCGIIQYSAVAHDRSVCRSWLWPAPFGPEHTLSFRELRKLAEPMRLKVIARGSDRIHRQDQNVGAQTQKVAHQIGRAPMLGVLEERIAWFEEAYRQVMSEQQ